MSHSQLESHVCAGVSGFSLLIACASLGASPALAQTQNGPSDDTKEKGQPTRAESQPNSTQETPAANRAQDVDQSQAQIIVTGSRISRAGFSAPTPTTVFDAQTLELKSARTVVETLALLPAFNGTSTPGTSGVTAAGPGGGGFLNLRGLGTNRTLILLDRQRLVPVDVTGNVDVSLLPTELLSGVDIVTGGASAAWGSDAVAGVVNFRLDSRYEGVALQGDTGISRYGDGFTYKVGVKFGHSFGAFHVVGTLEHEKNNGVSATDAQNRSFGLSDFGTVTNPNAPPALAILPNVYDHETFGGLILGGPLNNTQIMPGGQLAPYVPCGPITSVFVQCANVRRDLPYIGYFTQLYSPLTRTSGFVRGTWDVSPNFKVYADLLAGKSRTTFYTIPASSLVLGGITVNRDNAFLPPDLAAAMDANGLTSVRVYRYFRDQGPLVANRESGILRGSFGVSGRLGGTWKADAYVAYGASKLDAIFDNVTITQNFRNATDSVLVNGTPVCRINADALTANDDPNCQPLNFFGDGAILTTPNSVSYWTGEAYSKTRSHQFSAAGSISGEPFSTWAGPVSFAGGAEYRSYTAHVSVDPLSAAKRFFAINPQPISGTINVKEAFGEVVVPFAKDITLLHNLEINAAGRITDYSISGTVETWKLGANYSPVPGLRFRATISRDIRAPNVNELFSPLTQTAAINDVIDRRDNSVAEVRSLVGGNKSLKPEIAMTHSGGIVLEPSSLPGFHASADYFNIKVKGAITAPSVQQVIDACAAGESGFCNLVYRNDVAGASTGQLTRVDALYVNLAELKTRGIDFDSSYRFKAGDATISLRGLATYTMEFKQQTLASVLDFTDSQVNPRWSGDADGTVELNGTTFFVGATYRGPGRINPSFTRTALANNWTGGVIYIDTAIGHTFRPGGHTVNVRFSVDNLFDRNPPYGFPMVASGDTYDRVGRFFKLAARWEM